MRVKSVQDLPEAMRASAAAQLLTGSKPVKVDVVTVELDPDEDPERDKYGSTRVHMYGIWFGSKWEAQRYGELLMMERADLIRDLQVHQSFGLHVRTPTGDLLRVSGYEADFIYWRGERFMVEDTKSKPTRLKEAYQIKRKWFEAEYGLTITEVMRNKPRAGANV